MSRLLEEAYSIDAADATSYAAHVDNKQRYELGVGVGLDVESVIFGWPDVGRLDVRVEVEVDFRSGRYVCASLKVTSADEGDDGVTAEALRELPVGRIVTEVARDREVEGQLRARGRKVIAAGRSDDLTLEAVAACYRYGYAVGGSPTKEVMDLLGVPRSKAGRWVAMARQEGYLGETSPRVAGGVADDALLALDMRRAAAQDRLHRALDDLARHRADGVDLGAEGVKARARELAHELDRVRELEFELGRARAVLDEANFDVARAARFAEPEED